MSQESLQSELTNILYAVGLEVIQDIASPIETTRKKAMKALLSNVEKSKQQLAKKIMPVSLLDSNNYDGLMASVSWMIRFIDETSVDQDALEEIYGRSLEQFTDLIRSEDKEMKEKAQRLQNRLGKICKILSQKRKDVKSETNLYIDLFTARYKHDFEQNTEVAIKLTKETIKQGYEEGVLQLGLLYTESSKHREACALYQEWAEKTGKTLYYTLWISALYQAGKKQEASQLYNFCLVRADSNGEMIEPMILIKNAIEDDKDLEEMSILGVNLFRNHIFSPSYISIFSQAKNYIDNGIRDCHIAINNGSYDTQDESHEAQSYYRQFVATDRIAPDNHHIWIRLLFLYAINALVLTDNSPLRDFDITIGTEVPGKIKNKACYSNIAPNTGKVVRFLELTHALYATAEGNEVLIEFFHTYPFLWVGELLDAVEPEDNPDTDSSPEMKESRIAKNLASEKVYSGFVSQFAHENPIIFGPQEEKVDNSVVEGESEDEDTIDTKTGDIENKIGDFLTYIVRMYIGNENKNIIDAAYRLSNNLNDWSGLDEGEQRVANNDIEKQFQASLERMGKENKEYYESVGRWIRADMSEAVRKSIVVLAIDTDIINDGLPEYISKNYYLSWYFLMTHLLGNPTLNSDLLGATLEQQGDHFQEYEEDVIRSDSLLCSTLASLEMYEYFLCEFILKHHGYVTNPIFLKYLFLGISYLGNESKEKYLAVFAEQFDCEDIRSETIENAIKEARQSIDLNDGFIEDDRAKCDLSLGYLALSDGKSPDKIREILSPIFEGVTDGIPPATIAEAKFIIIRAELKFPQEKDIGRILSELIDLSGILAFEHQLGCYVTIFQLSQITGKIDILHAFHKKALKLGLPLGSWEYLPLILSDDEQEVQKGMYHMRQLEIENIPRDLQEILRKVCEKYLTCNLPIGEYGDIRFQSAYILANLPYNSLKESVEAIYSFFAWLDDYYRRDSVYTLPVMDEMIDCLEKTFGIVRKVSKEELKALKIKSSTILLQYVLDIFKEVNLIIGDLKAANNTPNKDGESWENVSGIWKRALMHYYKVLQRIPDPEVEGFIVNIRESYREGESEDHETSKGTFLRSGLIH